MQVLYVEDDEVTARIFTKTIKRIVKSVHHCVNGQLGLEAYRSLNPDIVITDIRMPIMSGLEMAKAIRQYDDEIAIIIVSAYDETDFLQEAFEAGITYYLNKPVNRLVLMRTLNESAKSVVYKRHQNELFQNYEETIDAFVNLIERRDRYTAGHSNRVANYCVMIAKAMQIDERECNLLEKAAKLHDIGKIEIPDSILLNPGKLNQLEYAIVQEHLNSGYAVLSGIKQYRDLSEIMRHHHEHYNGSGYPQGLKGDEIPLLSNIMMIADAFDAMTSNRIYKPRKSTQDALKEIHALRGKHFHPEIALIAIKVLENIKLDIHDDQMPETALEEKKFSYFFSDPLTGLYNENYLQSLITRKKFQQHKENITQHVTIINLHNISLYNKTHGWEKGNILLIKIAEYLREHLPDTLIFRIRGDQFFLLSQTELLISEIVLQQLIDDTNVCFDISNRKMFDELLDYKLNP